MIFSQTKCYMWATKIKAFCFEQGSGEKNWFCLKQDQGLKALGVHPTQTFRSPAAGVIYLPESRFRKLFKLRPVNLKAYVQFTKINGNLLTSSPLPLFPFRKRSLLILTVDATIVNQTYSHGRCNIFSALSYIKPNNTFLNCLRKTKFKPKLNLRLKLSKGLESPVINVSVIEVSLFGVLAVGVVA